MSELNRDTILEAEFNYVAETISQNHEERANVSGLYLTTVGSFVATILSFVQDKLDLQNIRLAFAGLFILLGCEGIRTLLELIRLRQAWFDSAYTMNTIKAYYIRQQSNQEGRAAFRKAFKWLEMPDGYKTGSVSFLLALQVAVLSGLSFGVAVGFVIWITFDKVKGVFTWGLIIAAFAGVVTAELWHYRRRLKGLKLKYPSLDKELSNEGTPAVPQ